MMRLAVFVMIALLGVPSLFAKKKFQRPYEEAAPTPTAEESTAAYDLCKKTLTATSKAPWAMAYPPIEETKIWAVTRNVSYNPNPTVVIKLMFEIVGQNSFGALEKHRIICVMNPKVPDSTMCNEY